MSTDHKHVWKGIAHIDGCHFYSWTLACKCGATRTTLDERDVKSDPYSMVWMDSEGGESCARCDALMAGATPKHSDETVEAS